MPLHRPAVSFSTDFMPSDFCLWLLNNSIIASTERNDPMYFDDKLLEAEDLDDWINRYPSDEYDGVLRVTK